MKWYHERNVMWVRYVCVFKTAFYVIPFSMFSLCVSLSDNYEIMWIGKNTGPRYQRTKKNNFELAIE